MSKKVWYRSKVLWFNALVAALAMAEVSLRVVQDFLPSNVFAWLTFVLTIGNAALRTVTRHSLTLDEPTNQSEQGALHVDDGINGG